MATKVRGTLETRLVHAAFPESGEIENTGPGKFEQEPLAKTFGKNGKSKKTIRKDRVPKRMIFRKVHKYEISKNICVFENFFFKNLKTYTNDPSQNFGAR